MIPVFKRAKKFHAFDRAATVTGFHDTQSRGKMNLKEKVLYF
jgi:hypothetical protein